MFLDQAETFGANGKNGEPVGATIRVFQSQDFILSKTRFASYWDSTPTCGWAYGGAKELWIRIFGSNQFLRLIVEQLRPTLRLLNFWWLWCVEQGELLL